MSKYTLRQLMLSLVNEGLTAREAEEIVLLNPTFARVLIQCRRLLTPDVSPEDGEDLFRDVVGSIRALAPGTQTRIHAVAIMPHAKT